MLSIAIFISVAVLTFIVPCESVYGAPCTSYLDSCDFAEQCRNGRCECNLVSRLSYDSKAVGSCEFFTTNLNCTGTCNSDQTCGRYGQCICANSSDVIVLGKCVKVHYQKALERCYLANNTAYFCSHENNSFCRGERCVCFSNHFFNQTSKECEPKSNYTTYHNIDVYKARPEEYCLNKADCIDGLRCLSNYVCDCPISCKYNKSEQICDCGKVSLAFPTGPTITGIVLGIFSIALWGVLIKRTIQKDKNRAEDLALSERTTYRDPSDVDETNYKPDAVPPYEPSPPNAVPPYESSPPPYTINPQMDNGSAPPLGFDVNNVPFASKGGNVPPPYSA